MVDLDYSSKVASSAVISSPEDLSGDRDVNNNNKEQVPGRHF
jgi:hypothetical protein